MGLQSWPVHGEDAIVRPNLRSDGPRRSYDVAVVAMQ